MLVVGGSLMASAKTNYVNAARPDDLGAGTSWATAKRTIQAAVNLSAAGDTVLVTNGTYNTGVTLTPSGTLSNRVVITQAITVRSVNGATSTFIEGAGTNRYGTASAVRCVFMTNGVLEGFTLRYGATGPDTTQEINRSGGGVHASGAVISNCVLTNNIAYGGGGAGYGSLTSCVVTGNKAVYGAGILFGSATQCTIAGNEAEVYGGGSYDGVRVNCTLKDNQAKSGGGGTYYGTLTNCTFVGNKTTADGGGAYKGTLVNCVLSNNTADCGGGIFYSQVYNSLFKGNVAERGGGSSFGSLVNCTLTGNSATHGGGAFAGGLVNSIIYGNTATEEPNYSASRMTYSCSTPLYSDVGNIDSDPLLIDARHIRTNSPCVGAGNYLYCLGTDIDGEAWLNPPCMGCDQVAPTYDSLSVTSAFGGASPTGSVYLHGTVVNAIVTNSPIANGTTQYVCTGASVFGTTYTQNSATNINLKLTNNVTLTWLWKTNYWLSAIALTNGSVSLVPGWQGMGVSTQVTANAESYFHFVNWTGNAGVSTNNPLLIVVDRPVSLIASFSADMTVAFPTPYWWLARNGFATSFEQASLEDIDGDGYPAWAEYVADTVPTNRESFFKAQIFFQDGLPQITWSPDLGAARVYTVEGQTNLAVGTWGATNSACRFFRVKISMP